MSKHVYDLAVNPLSNLLGKLKNIVIKDFKHVKKVSQDLFCFVAQIFQIKKKKKNGRLMVFMLYCNEYENSSDSLTEPALF